MNAAPDALEAVARRPATRTDAERPAAGLRPAISAGVIRLAVLFLATLLFPAPSSRGQDQPAGPGKDSDDNKDAARKHYLTFQVGFVGTARSRDEFPPRETELNFADSLSGKIEVRPEAAENGVIWYPRGETVPMTGRIAETMTTRTTLTGEGEVRATETRVESYTGQPAFAGNFGNAFVRIHPTEKRYDIQFVLMADMASSWEAVEQSTTRAIVGAPSLGGGKREAPPPQRMPLMAGAAQMGLKVGYEQLSVDIKGEALADDAGELLGTKLIPVPKPPDWKGDWNIGIEVSWQIDVSLPPVELVVTVPGYAQWRPEGSIKKPAEPGNSLVARATLRPKEAGAVKLVPKVKSIRFELLDTSREPGVCLNWPLEAKDTDYDLRLAAVAGGALSKSDQHLEVIDPGRNDEGQAYAEAGIDSYDFGGRASLRVVCKLADGREIVGTMEGEGETPRLPKMNGPDWIAESWRKEKKVEKLAADDDEEKVEGQKDNGDGFTLYEEYRGWVENGKHIEGDPARKDFFVLNMIGADGRAGIELFETLSKLRVHSKLRRWEMSPETRRMNGNHRDAPHRVAQHGVWVKTFSRAALGDNGAATEMTKAGVAGRPGITKGIGILSRGNPASVFNQPFNLPAQDTVFAYDRAIAHELLHSVGVEHHGGGDYRQIVGYVSPRNPANKIGRPYYGSSPGKPVEILDEAGHDLATRDYADYVKLREFSDQAMLERELAEGKAYIARNGVGWNGIHTPQQYADMNIELLIIFCFMHLDGLVGITHGEHSGDQDCVMRYAFAKFYEASRSKDNLYLVTPGTDRIGLEICRATTGTGINAAGHRPQSRHGNATTGQGDCFSQICPNDAIPPRKTK